MLPTFICALIAPPPQAPPPRPAGLEFRAAFVDARVICIEGESLGPVLLEMSLVNRSTETWAYLPLLDAVECGALDVRITQPDGSAMRAHGSGYELNPKPFYEQLQPGKSIRTTLSLAWFGYDQPYQVGKFTLNASFQCRGWMLVTRPIEFEVIRVAPKAILASAAIPLSDKAAKDPVDKRKSAFVEQIRVGDRVFLFYRRFSSIGERRLVEVATRITELPDKVEMKVEGAYERQKPLSITFKDRRSKSGTTTILIDSTNGELWDEGDDQPPDDGPPRLPPPRVIKP